MKEKNVDVVGTVHGRLVGVATHTLTVVNSEVSKEMAAWTVAVQLADGTKMLTLFDCITFDSATQMHAAAASGFLHIVQVLVKRGADVGSKDAYGNTPLSDALQNKAWN